MTRESQTGVFITLEEIQILHDALDAQYDSNFESDYEIMREEMNKCDWDYVHDMACKFKLTNDAFEILKQLKEKGNPNSEKKNKDSDGADSE